MKLIEAMKIVKEQLVKADDLRKKIGNHSAHLSIETPVYKEQASVVSGWLQAHEDITRNIEDLLTRIARTNINTLVPIKIGDVTVSKPITGWINRRRTLANFDEQAFSQLTDRNLREGAVPSSAGAEPTRVTIVRCYDPLARDKKVELYRNEPSLIDRTLEVVNAVTDLLD